MSVLHFTRTIPALLPRYVSRFRCIGSECEDNCCTGWRVSIDKKTFTAYRQTSHPALRTLFQKNVKRQRSMASDADYARIALDPVTQECPMLEDRLCAVHKNLDASYLSNTCFSYPRLSRSFGGQHEQTLTLSCPEAARQALLASDAFDFIEGTITVRGDTLDQVQPSHGLSIELMNEVRIFCLQLMRTEGLELWQRLAVTGVFCERLTEHLEQGMQSEVASLLETFVMMVEKGLVLDALAEMRPNHVAQAKVFSIFWNWKTDAPRSALQHNVFDAISKGLGAHPGSGDTEGERLVEHYLRGVTRLPEALAAAPHLLENYILNEMFFDVFPFNGATPFDNYLQLVSRFGLLRLMLSAQCNTDAALPDPAALVQTVHVYCRGFQHDRGFASQVNNALHASGLAKLDKIFGFLRT